MPRYDFRCTECGREFEVSRTFSESSAPVSCPLDSATCVRVLSMPTVLVRGGGSTAGGAAPAPAPSAAPGWSHFGHSHGAGSGSHAH